MFHNGYGISPIDDSEALADHEAGHAVAALVFGFGLANISLRLTVTGQEYAATGAVRISNRARRASVVEINGGKYSRALAEIGIFSAAGPAAERKFKLLRGVDPALLGASEGDHKAIDAVDRILGNHDRRPFAFRRLVWKAVQDFLDVPDRWSAVELLAEDLYAWRRPLQDEDASGDHSVFETVQGATARTVPRRNGLHFGGAGVRLRKPGGRRSPART